MREKQLQEALVRMRMLKLHSNTLGDLKEGVINKSELGGYLYWLDQEEQEIIKQWEEEYKSLVYHVIKTQTEFGLLLNILYVSNYPEEWEMDRKDIEKEMIVAYVKNMDDDYCSEFGTIGVASRYGGLVRTF